MLRVKKHPTKSEIVAKYNADSRCDVGVAVTSNKHGKYVLKHVQIELYGGIAHVPSLKQQKIPGKNFMSNLVKYRLQIMDVEYKRSVSRFPQQINFGDEMVGLLMICATRSVRFDPDNCLSTICDWLEPSTKPVGKRRRNRGWGVGLVNNDSQIIGQAYRDKDLGLSMNYTLIILKRWSDIKESFVNWAKENFLQGAL